MGVGLLLLDGVRRLNACTSHALIAEICLTIHVSEAVAQRDATAARLRVATQKKEFGND
jgi:hypothetical protein